MTTNVSGWLPNLIGPVEVQLNGTAQTPRAALNFVGVNLVDNPDQDRIDITPFGASIESPVITGTVTYQGTLMRILSIPGEFLSVGAVTDTIAEFTMLDNTTCTFDFTVAMRVVGAGTKAGSWTGRTTYYRNGGAPVLVGSAEYGTAQETTGGDGVLFAVTGNVVKVRVTGADADNRNWGCELRVQEILNT